MTDIFATPADKGSIDLLGTVGRNYFVRTVTFAYVGRLIVINEEILRLDRCTWIASTGPYGPFVRTGNSEEQDSYPRDMHINIRRALVIETFEIPWELPDAE